mmetsp:Transcript_11128/g.29588  ORF Transcript_11128/g.29588 Transcript_11128/m.29588 type:complete len:204 (-) Transcript_11128:643-1254(-)
MFQSGRRWRIPPWRAADRIADGITSSLSSRKRWLQPQSFWHRPLRERKARRVSGQHPLRSVSPKAVDEGGQTSPVRAELRHRDIRPPLERCGASGSQGRRRRPRLLAHRMRAPPSLEDVRCASRPEGHALVRLVHVARGLCSNCGSSVAGRCCWAWSCRKFVAWVSLEGRSSAEYLVLPATGPRRAGGAQGDRLWAIGARAAR